MSFIQNCTSSLTYSNQVGALQALDSNVAYLPTVINVQGCAWTCSWNGFRFFVSAELNVSVYKWWMWIAFALASLNGSHLLRHWFTDRCMKSPKTQPTAVLWTKLSLYGFCPPSSFATRGTEEVAFAASLTYNDSAVCYECTVPSLSSRFLVWLCRLSPWVTPGRVSQCCRVWNQTGPVQDFVHFYFFQQGTKNITNIQRNKEKAHYIKYTIYFIFSMEVKSYLVWETAS